MIAICDKRLPEEYKIKLKNKINHNLNFVSLDFNCKIKPYTSISHHPDIYIFKFDKNTCIHAPCVAENILRKNKKVKYIKGSHNPGYKYPHTAIYNAVRLGNNILHNLKYTEKNILEFAVENKIQTINIPQGYSRCSILPIGDHAIITSDNGVAKSAIKNKIDVLLVKKGNIILPGEKYGFLGGATGILPDNRIVFIGNINEHPDSEKINFFLKKHGAKWISLEGLPLFDCGTIIFF